MRDPGTPVKATATSFTVIEAIQSGGSAGISELAREIGLSKSAVYKHVQTLAQLGYLARDGDEYHLSLRFLSLGTRARDRFPLDAVETVVSDLAETTGHAANFIARENDRGVYAFRVEPAESHSRHLSEGATAPLHATAGGKAILAFLDDGAREDVLNDAAFEAFTDKTVTDRAALERELRSIREKRVAMDRGEFREDTQCVTSPVVDTDASPVGAISVTGSVHRLSGKRLEEDVVGHVTSAAKTVERSVRTA